MPAHVLHAGFQPGVRLKDASLTVYAETESASNLPAPEELMPRKRAHQARGLPGGKLGRPPERRPDLPNLLRFRLAVDEPVVGSGDRLTQTGRQAMEGRQPHHYSRP